MAQFVDADKSRIRYHLRYPDVQVGATSVNGVLQVTPVQNELEFAMNNVPQTAIDRVLGILTSLDGIETQMIDANDRLRATKADVVTLNPEEHDQLRKEYRWWQSRLCDTLSVKVNPYANKSGGTLGVNVKVNKRG